MGKSNLKSQSIWIIRYAPMLMYAMSYNVVNMAIYSIRYKDVLYLSIAARGQLLNMSVTNLCLHNVYNDSKSTRYASAAIKLYNFIDVVSILVRSRIIYRAFSYKFVNSI